jgi:hypothetical protein
MPTAAAAAAAPQHVPLLLPTASGAPAVTEVLTFGGEGFLGALARGEDDAEPLPPRAVARLAAAAPFVRPARAAEGWDADEAWEWLNYNTIRACEYTEGAPALV